MNQQTSKKMTVGFLLTLFGLGAFAGSAQAASWDDVKLKGDLRYRHEMKEEEGVDETRHRQRIRGRVGLWGKVNESIDFGLRLATGGTGIVSTNTTLDGHSANKEFDLDMYFIDWKAMDGLHVIAGKMANPLVTNPMIWDGDVTPEGIALTYNRDMDSFSTFFNLAGFWQEENGSSSDLGTIATQLGAVIPMGNHKLTAGIGHHSFVNYEGTTPTIGANGNTLTGTDYASDFRVTEFFVEFKTIIAELPLKIGGSYFSNSEATTDNDKGHWAAIRLGDTKKTGWAVEYANYKAEADSTLGVYVDSDALDNQTDGEGNMFSAAYQLADNTEVKASYFIFDLGISGTSTEHKLGQLDFVFKF